MSESSAIVAPVIALVCWHHLMWLWMYATRIPAIQGAGMKMDPTRPAGEQMAMLPPSVRWKADNYNHLFEAPVLFYAVALSLAVLGAGSGWNVTLAWAYVLLRVIHSVFQSTVNKIEVRFGIFVLSSLVLFALTFNAARLVF
ncbi:MAG: MAPEG family protein [Candidatus Binatia bacterium]